MKAGRELDALVAEKVMGWSALEFVKHSGPLNMDFPERHLIAPGRDRVPHVSQETFPDGKTIGPVPGRVPHYSTDIAAAWEVVEKVAAWSFEVIRREHDPGKILWLASIYPRAEKYADRWDSSKGTLFIEGKSAPHAICLAALKSVGAL
jgi:hypothetical protein